MSKPQQPEIARSRKTPSQDPDSAAAVIEGSRPPVDDGAQGPVPPDNQPGHHPPEEQDKPDLNAFAERLGTAGTTAPAPASAGTAPPEPARGWAPARTPARRGIAALLGAAAVLVVGRVLRRRVRPA